MESFGQTFAERAETPRPATQRHDLAEILVIAFAATLCGVPNGRGAGVRDRPQDRRLGRLRREGRSLTRSRSAQLDLSHSGEVGGA